VGIALAMPPPVLRHPIPRAFLMFIPLVICAGRVRGHEVATPGAVTQEVNRCLTMVRIAATRRSPNKGATRCAVGAGYSWQPRRAPHSA
jgi:hypothetical protein